MNNIKLVKENRNIETEELQGYQVDFGDGGIWSVSVGGNRYNEVQEWIAEGNTPEPAYTEEERQAYLDNKAIQEAKQAKEVALSQITVTTTSGKVFDGRDKDQLRMLSAIQTSTILGTTETQWKLNDNTVATISLDELKEALALSIQAVGNIVLGVDNAKV